jgi:hypothetical protein
MATTTKSTNAAFLQALADGPASAAELRKATKMDDDEFDAYLNGTAKARLWVTEDDSGRTTKYALTDMGRAVLTSRYSN